MSYNKDVQLIAHQGLWKKSKEQNTLSAFEAALRAGYAVQADLRSHGGQLFLSETPIAFPQAVPRLEALLRLPFKGEGSRVFLRVKEEGLLELLRPYKPLLEDLNIVFIDLTVRELVRYAKHFPPSMLATRVSDLEPHPSAAQLCEWIFIDGFFRDLNPQELKYLSKTFPNHRRVFVSPEIQGRDKDALWHYLTHVSDVYALCTNLPHTWA